MNSKQISTRHTFTRQIFGKVHELPAADTRRIPTTVAKAGTSMLTIAAAPMIPSRPTVLAFYGMFNAMFATSKL